MGVLTDTQQSEEGEDIDWDNDPYPVHRLREIEQSSERSDLMGFIQSLNSRIEYSRPVPRHWVEFTARLLQRAAKVADEDPAARDNPLAKEMGLSGRKSNLVRDLRIASTVHELVRKDDKRGAVKRAVLTVMQELDCRGIVLSERVIRRIYESKDKEFLEEHVSVVDRYNIPPLHWLDDI